MLRRRDDFGVFGGNIMRRGVKSGETGDEKGAATTRRGTPRGEMGGSAIGRGEIGGSDME